MGEWQPMETYKDGDHVLFYFPHGERGNGGIETAMLFRRGDCWDFWTHGGPNSGSDFEVADNERPTMWRHYDWPSNPIPGPPSSEPELDWEAWRAENRRIVAAGGRLSSIIKVDGSSEHWAELDGKRWRHEPSPMDGVEP